MAWDQGEDNLLVSFNDGVIILIAYNGLDNKT